MVVNELATRLASRMKGAEFQVDPQVGVGSLISVASERGLMATRGVLRFPCASQRPYLGRGARVKSSRLLRVGRGVTLGPGTYVDALSTGGVYLGNHTSLGRNSRIECTGTLTNLGVGFRAGSNVGLGADCFYGAAGGIEIGDDTIIGNYVSFHSENHVVDDVDVPIRNQGVTRQGITIGRDCWLGAKVTVLDGVTLGDGCIVAAGCVLTAGDYPALTVYGGVPARPLATRDAAGASRSANEG